MPKNAHRGSWRSGTTASEKIRGQVMMASGEIRLYSTTMRQMPVLAQSQTSDPYPALNNPNYFSVSGGLTFQLGVSISGDFFGASGVAAVGIAVDSSGNAALYGEWGGGVATSPDGSVNIVGHISDAPTVNDLSGPFVNVSSGGGWGYHATGDGFYGTGQQGQPVLGTGFSVGAGAGGASSVTYTTTAVSPSVNVWNSFWNTFFSVACGWAICGF